MLTCCVCVCEAVSLQRAAWGMAADAHRISLQTRASGVTAAMRTGPGAHSLLEPWGRCLLLVVKASSWKTLADTAVADVLLLVAPAGASGHRSCCLCHRHQLWCQGH